MHIEQYLALALASLVFSGCSGDRGADPYDLDFEIPRTETFAESLSAYALFEGPIASLQPADNAVVVELSSELFTDYAKKQRLVVVPEGESIVVDSSGTRFPEGTVLAKTFYYPEDMREAEGPKRIIETRLLVKTDGVWNVATYLWNAEQTDATLLLEGATTDVAWLDEAGASRRTEYEVPHEGQCVTCHQADGEAAFIGPSLRNLNRAVVRDDSEVNQLDYLQSLGIVDSSATASALTIPNYRDTDQTLGNRARAYLDINCAHCHNPDGWDQASRQEFDFRYSTALDETGLNKRVARVLEDGEMPFIGTTLKHEEGIRLVVDYLDTLPGAGRP